MRDVKKDNENRAATLRAILSHVEIDDPGFRLFLKQEISSSYRKHKQNDISKETIRRLRIQNKKLLEQVSLLKDRQKQMKTDRTEVLSRQYQLIKLNNSLSGALGSCNICWGENQNCPSCSGNGYSGWRDVNKRLFNIYILPALEKIYRFEINN